MPLESWYVFLQICSAVLLGLTFFVGAATIFVGMAVNDRQAERIAETEKQTAELNVRFSGRELTPDQSMLIADSLGRFAGKELFITSYTGDAEAARLGLQIEAALEDAGILVADRLSRTQAQGDGVAFGVRISGPASERELIDAITESLVRSDLEASGHVVFPEMRVGNAVVGIMVALKPIPNSNR